MTPRLTAAQFRAQHGSPLPHPSAVGGCKVRMPRRLEREVQPGIVDMLRLHGYTVLITSQRRAKPPEGLTPAQRNAWYATGNTKGISDLLVGRAEWGPMFLLVEVKRDSKGTLTAEQTELFNRGQLIVAWTPDMALAACDRVRTAIAAVKEAERGDVRVTV